jgi:hypothetical protein
MFITLVSTDRGLPGEDGDGEDEDIDGRVSNPGTGEARDLLEEAAERVGTEVRGPQVSILL